MSEKTYVFEQTPPQSMDPATAALLSGRNNGGLFGGNGGIEGLIGLIIAAGIFGGNGNGWFGGGNNNNTWWMDSLYIYRINSDKVSDITKKEKNAII